MNDVKGTIDITADYDSTGEAVVLDTVKDHTLDVVVDADAAADFEIDVSPGGVNWYSAFSSYTGVSSIREGGFQAARFVRFKVSSSGGTGGSNDTADVYLASAGDS